MMASLGHTTLNFTGYFTLTLILLTLCVSACQGQRQTCTIYSTQHPQGLCSTALADTLANICAYLRENYPRYYPSKRSAENSYYERISNVPLSELELNTNTGEKEATNDLLNNEGLSADAGYRPHLGNHQPVYADDTGMAKLLSGKGYDRLKRQAFVATGIVCDCCYHFCTYEHMATYC